MRIFQIVNFNKWKIPLQFHVCLEVILRALYELRRRIYALVVLYNFFLNYFYTFRHLAHLHTITLTLVVYGAYFMHPLYEQ